MMKLNDIDRSVWGRISSEIGQIADEIADDLPLAVVDEDPWPGDSIGVKIYELLGRAEMLALFASRIPGGSRASMTMLRSLYQPEMDTEFLPEEDAV